MDAVEQVLPSGADVGRIAVIGYLVDENTKVIVGGLVGVFIVELLKNVSESVRRRYVMVCLRRSWAGEVH